MRIAMAVSPAHRSESTGRVWEVLAGCMRSGDTVELWDANIMEREATHLALPMPMEVFCPGAGPVADPAAWLEQLCLLRRPELMLFYGDNTGHEMAVRLAARLSCGLLTDAHTLLRDGEGLCAVRKSCSSHHDWHMSIQGAPFVLSVVRGSARVLLNATPSCVTVTPSTQIAHASWVLKREPLEQAASNPLESARRVLIGGHGLGNRENCDRMRAAAARCGAVPGFTRAAALSGWCGLDEIVGQSGVRTSPELCVALGVSGASAFLAGVSGAGKLIAVNTDADAPIFQHADIGIVADALPFLDALGRDGGGNDGI